MFNVLIQISVTNRQTVNPADNPTQTQVLGNRGESKDYLSYTYAYYISKKKG